MVEKYMEFTVTVEVLTDVTPVLRTETVSCHYRANVEVRHIMP